jgi:glycolate oxidase iron-sulfur subunit
VTAPLAFDADAAARVREAVDTCVHCGFCLPACPTYGVLGQEGDSPRGRLVLMRQLLEGAAGASDRPALDHLARCLDCRACETACPSGVPYGRALEAVRATLGPGQLPAPIRTGLRAALSRPGRVEGLRLPLRWAQRSGVLGRLAGAALGPGARAAAAGLPPLPRRGAVRLLPTVWEPEGEPRGSVTVLTGCVMDLAFAPANWATAALARLAGYRVVTPARQGCCGALALHAGDRAAARAQASALIAALDRDGAAEGAVVVNSAGCGFAMKEYGDLFADDAARSGRASALAARVVDFTQWLAAHLPPPPARPFDRAVAYDHPCHLLHGQRVADPPRQILRHVGARLVALPDADRCCGAAGLYGVLQPEVSRAVLARKMDAVRVAVAAGAKVLVTANPGCQMQLRQGVAAAGLKVPVLHVAEVAAVAYGLVPPAELGATGWPRS